MLTDIRLWLVLVLALGLLVSWRVLRPPKFRDEIHRRAWEHNRNRGDYPEMCEHCGAYKRWAEALYSFDGPAGRWKCDLCASLRSERKARVEEEVRAHNERIRQARSEADAA